MSRENKWKINPYKMNIDLQNRNLTLYSAKLRSQSICKITNKKLTVQMLFANLFCNLYDLSYLCDINIVGM